MAASRMAWTVALSYAARSGRRRTRENSEGGPVSGPVTLSMSRSYATSGSELWSILMVSERSTFEGRDLHLDLDGPGGRRSSLEEALRGAIRSGRLPTGTRLPSTRALAADLGLARGTVTDAYDQLAAEGWLVARQGSGTRVASAPGPADRPT